MSAFAPADLARPGRRDHRQGDAAWSETRAGADGSDSTLTILLLGPLAQPTLAADALRAGTLVAPFKERAETGIGYYLVTSATRSEPKTVRDVKAWIREEIRETEAMFGGGVR